MPLAFRHAYVQVRSRLVSAWRSTRAILWRRGWVYAAAEGWRDRLREVASVPVWKGLDSNGNSIVGAPLEWSLLRSDLDGGIQPEHASCAWSGRQIQGVWVDPAQEDWGARCCRCGIPIHVTSAGMRHALDPPSCPPCRRAVRRLQRAIQLGD